VGARGPLASIDMPGIHRKKTLIHDFSLWVAAGGDIPSWCETHGMRLETGYRWYKDDDCRRMVAEYRTRAVDLAIGEMAQSLGKAVKKIIHLIEEGETDGVKLSAARTLVDKLIAVQNHAELKSDLKRLDERLGAQEERRARATATTRKPDRKA
jgi:hypothetical protein